MVGCATPLDAPPSHGREHVAEFVQYAHKDPSAAVPDVRLERISAAVPWPRGLAFVDGELVVLARGRHRRSGGVSRDVADQCGHVFAVDVDVSEPVVPGEPTSAAVQDNARLLTAPGGPFLLYDPATEPIDDTRMDRPYCTLIYDERSRNLFVCGFSGVDLPGGRFRKNATDSIHRFDLRTEAWYPVEMHDPSVVPSAELGRVVPNRYYPHHDPEHNEAPHGWLNGPNGGCVAGRYLYCLGKDNHAVVAYDLAELRERPDAGPPPSELVFGREVIVQTPVDRQVMDVPGPSAIRWHEGYLYVGYRTASVVLRFATDAEGAVVQPAVGELVAVFEPWSVEHQRSANLIDLAFNSRGELFVSCAGKGRIWRVGRPDPRQPFHGVDRGPHASGAAPYADLAELAGVNKGCGNIVFDDRDRLYLCAGNYDAATGLAGAIYRVVEVGPVD